MSKTKAPKPAPEATVEDPKLGRPSLFNDSIREKMIELAGKGKTNQQIADIIGVHVRTIENWQGKHKELMWALKEAKQVADDLVEASLFSRAVGYSHKEVKVFFDSKSLQTVEHEVVQQYAPDTTAAIFWLKNRQPDKWREKQPGEPSDVTVNITGLPDADLDARIQKLMGEK